MRAEVLSREMLVVRAAYCLVHEAAGRGHPLVLQYGVLGRRPWLGLRHLVLGSREAVHAEQAMCSYLQRAVRRTGGRASGTVLLRWRTGPRQLGYLRWELQAPVRGCRGSWCRRRWMRVC